MGLHTTKVIIEGKLYNVQDYPRKEAEKEGPDILRKGTAYRIVTDITRGVFPYRGTIHKHEHWTPYQAKTGLYLQELSDGTYRTRISYPKTAKEKEGYSLSNIKDIAAAILDNSDTIDQFYDIHLNVSDYGEVYHPPMHSDDDPLNMIMKAAIIIKEAPFEPYGKRLEALATDRSHGSEGSNIRNNAKRAFRTNTTMSPSKFILYADNWQLDAAIILKDREGAMHPMFTNGEMLVLFPNSEPFEIDSSKLINAYDTIQQAIVETNSEEASDKNESEDEDG